MATKDSKIVAKSKDVKKGAPGTSGVKMYGLDCGCVYPGVEKGGSKPTPVGLPVAHCGDLSRCDF